MRVLSRANTALGNRPQGHSVSYAGSSILAPSLAACKVTFPRRTDGTAGRGPRGIFGDEERIRLSKHGGDGRLQEHRQGFLQESQLQQELRSARPTEGTPPSECPLLS